METAYKVILVVEKPLLTDSSKDRRLWVQLQAVISEMQVSDFILAGEHKGLYPAIL